MILIKLVYSEIGPEIKKARVLFTSHYTNLEVSLHCSVRTLPVIVHLYMLTGRSLL